MNKRAWLTRAAWAASLSAAPGAAQTPAPAPAASAAPGPSTPLPTAPSASAPAAAAPSGGAPAPSAGAPAAATPPPAPPSDAACVEKLPSGKARPAMRESFPRQGLSGHALPLVVTVPHGGGETVLPTGFRFQPDTPQAKALKQAGFLLPAPDGGAGPTVARDPDNTKPSSTVTISFVALPDKPGRHSLTLPSLPITVARASGDLITLCTQPHTVVVEDPISSTPNPKPKPNPLPRPQVEEWTFLKHAVAIAAIALLVGAVITWLVSRWLKRPRPQPPPPPPRPPWEVAFESLHDLQHAGLTREGRYAEHFDRVSDVVRRYLGDRYGFDGLESTTRELLGELRATTPRIEVLDDIERFMREADLVKFARLTPSEVECATALSQATSIVERTIPAPAPPGAPATEQPQPRSDGDG